MPYTRHPGSLSIGFHMGTQNFLSTWILLSFVAMAENANSQPSDGTRQPRNVYAGPNFQLFPSTITQSEPFVVRHPTNSSILFASANTINLTTGFVSEGVYVTTDGGGSWFGNDTCKGAPITFHRGDPAIVIDKDGRLILSRLGSAPGLYGHFSTNNGATWSSQRTLAQDDQSRAALTTNDIPASPYYGLTYAVWVRFSPPYPIWFSSTSDGGATWSSASAINSPSQRGQGGDIVVGPEGNLYVCWSAVISSSPFTEDAVGFARSTNGGVSWSVQESAFDMNGIAGTFPAKSNIRVNGLPRIAVDRSGGPYNGSLYIVTTERTLSPAGNDPDIILHRSTNAGATWSPGARVNQDAPNNGKHQFFPAIHVDGNGGVNILYYDDRSTTNDSSGVFLSRSTDGGTTWSDHPISDRNFRPQPIGGLGQGYQGDNIAMTSVGDTLWPLWMDNRSGLYQIWTSVVGIPDLDTDVAEESEPRTFSIEQNYPNPFNPTTAIEYVLQQGGHVTFAVFDGSGKEVAVLVNTRQDAGRHKIQFDAGKYALASGVYTYRLRVDTRSIVKRMILVK